MKAVLQRVKDPPSRENPEGLQRAGASVFINGKEISRIGTGLLVFLGIAEGDTEEQARRLAKKIADLRVFPDRGISPERSQRMSLSVKDIAGEVLVVSQFTLLADTSQGNRPSFVKAANPERARRLYELFVKELAAFGVPVKTGEFGACMQVSLVNDGPVTIILEVT